jgi:hypothetical protein
MENQSHRRLIRARNTNTKADDGLDHTLASALVAAETFDASSLPPHVHHFPLSFRKLHRVSGVFQLNVEWRRGEREVTKLPKPKWGCRGQVRTRKSSLRSAETMSLKVSHLPSLFDYDARVNVFTIGLGNTYSRVRNLIRNL